MRLTVGGNKKMELALLDAYRQMAADAENEREALEWSEGLIADSTLDEKADDPLDK